MIPGWCLLAATAWRAVRMGTWWKPRPLGCTLSSAGDTRIAWLGSIVATYWWVWRSFCGVLVAAGVAIGVVVLPAAVLVLFGLLVLVLALTAAVGCQSTSGSSIQEHRARIHAVLRVVTPCLIVMAVAALAVILRAGVLVFVLLLGAASPRAVRWYGRMLHGQAATAPSQPVRSSTMDITQLCREWGESHEALRQAASNTARLRIVMARERCLNELERRDPDGFHAWLASAASAGGDPSRFLTRNHSDPPPTGT
jgi:hypothetical protein